MIDDTTVGFADYSGNLQYITLGNLKDNAKAYLFLIDYAHMRTAAGSRFGAKPARLRETKHCRHG